MFAYDSNETTLQVVDNDLRVALGLDAFVIATIHSTLNALVHLTVDLCQVVAGSRRHKDH